MDAKTAGLVGITDLCSSGEEDTLEPNSRFTAEELREAIAMENDRIKHSSVPVTRV